jgi:hypothetical protein
MPQPQNVSLTLTSRLLGRSANEPTVVETFLYEGGSLQYSRRYEGAGAGRQAKRPMTRRRSLALGDMRNWVEALGGDVVLVVPPVPGARAQVITVDAELDGTRRALSVRGPEAVQDSPAPYAAVVALRDRLRAAVGVSKL